MNENPTDAEEQFGLGLSYYKGDGVPKDIEKAIYWFTKAAEQGQALAQNGLGCCYYKGEGVPKDLKKAVYWWTKAADQGQAEAQSSLRVLRRQGLL